MSGRRKKSRPYVMRGPPAVTAPRPTTADEPDYRIIPVQRSPLRPISRRIEIPLPCVAPHRLMLRWAASIGDGLPSDKWDDEHRTATLTPLPDDVAIAVDQTVLHSPDHVRTVIQLWYKSPLPVSEIAKELGVDRNVARERWLASLGWLRPEFVSLGIL